MSGVRNDGVAVDSAVAPVWVPALDGRSQMEVFLRRVQQSGAPGSDAVRDYRTLHAWSVAERASFWRLLWESQQIVAEGVEGASATANAGYGLDRMAPPDAVLGPRWFPDARLNFAENLLRHAEQPDAAERAAIIFWNERGRQRLLTFAELRREVARVAAGLRAEGVGVGDRVAAFMPNLPETVIAMLAATSLGAVWSSCSPDFGVRGVLDRFGQIAPTVLIAADGYRYAGKQIDVLPRVREVVASLGESLRRVVIVPYLRDEPVLDGFPRAVRWPDFGAAAPGAGDAAPAYVRLPFDHPVYIMYSSGTTGLPKCMVHGAGGTLLQHLKEHALHTDIRAGDRVFYATTCGWMMWNWLVSALATGATVVLYDGAPLAPNPRILWDMAAAEQVRVFGTSAKYLALAQKEGVTPAATHDLSALDTVLSTGSPLAAGSYDYVATQVKPGVRLSSISGGTDIICCFALGNPATPVWRGELQSLGLGMAVGIRGEDGRELPAGSAGELVCTAPFPSMPVHFWNDPDGAKYRAAYFEHSPGVWRHGDWAEITVHDGLVIHGRSDATLNPGGVRIGTAEIYRVVDEQPEIVESVVIGQAVGPAGNRDVRIVLFVRMRAGATLDRQLESRLRELIRESLSPHHAPRKIVQVADIPRTISGKISETAVRDVVNGRPVSNRDSLANPESLALFRDLPQLGGAS